eukprot:scaffold190225_cov16-Tisochrysis_lutea.AAC.1
MVDCSQARGQSQEGNTQQSKQDNLRTLWTQHLFISDTPSSASRLERLHGPGWFVYRHLFCFSCCVTADLVIGVWGAPAWRFEVRLLGQAEAHFGPLWWESMGGSFLNACGQTASEETIFSGAGTSLKCTAITNFHLGVTPVKN